MVWFLEHSKKYNEALEYCEKALKINPDYVYAISYKGKLLLLLKKYEESLKWYNKAIELDPKNQTAIFHRYKVQGILDDMKKESFLKRLSKL
jgi:tetratricopeptide (TPR) repeat protein